MRSLAAGVLAILVSSSNADAISAYSIAVVCKMDMEQYCKAIPKTRLRDLRECLQKHEKNLFPQCQDHYKEAR